MKVLVVGATGGTGREIVRELVERQIPVRALVRCRHQALSLWSPAVEIVEGNVLDRYVLQDAIGDCTTLICATGARPSLNFLGPLQVDYWGTQNLIHAAQHHQLQHFVIVSSLLTSVFWHPLNLFWLVLFWKKQAEQSILRSGIPYTIVRPGGLTNQGESDPIVMQGADSLFAGRIPRRQVAQVCVEALLCPDARYKIVEVVTRPGAVSVPIPELFALVP